MRGRRLGVWTLTSGVTAVLPLCLPTFLRLSSSPTSVRRSRGKPECECECAAGTWQRAQVSGLMGGWC
ncbi:uncharacterized protein SETTUDRAFT_162015 [Exserohilum turcica Et28A]|uniref:Uncharacterized protein n=1 Tax=Exserohilum turcicum (strain 28A) TaxID=671987 RepID=R0KTZ6_EXST2|nr:uncharacterized protein SETTUDRAFT_162015 [Exserohilum turcica Et28A]EOA91237.1 hypothetical protein SETTUDRAFT_162015 [Exserohilum turcica Et28A]